MNKLSTITAALILSTANLVSASDTQLYWGDTHLHTSNSFDVFLYGTKGATLDIAYRFAKGLPVVSPTTNTTRQLSTPLDFVVIADHALMMGTLSRLFADDPLLSETKSGKGLREVGGKQSAQELLDVKSLIYGLSRNLGNKFGLTSEDVYKDLHGGIKRRSTWDEHIATADQYNEPGVFTAMIGWEWTSTTGGANLHRVVFTPQDATIAGKFLPYSALESDDPEDLWAWLGETSEKTGADFLAIPHNSNVSIGRMFPLVTESGKRISEDYAKQRMKWERVVEVTQIRGDSEAHPLLAPTDEFADYEIFPFVLASDGRIPEPTKADYVRTGLKRGLELEAQLGSNPYKTGMIGSTDSHTGMSAVEENNFAGKAQHDSFVRERSELTGIGASKGWDMGAAGYAGVWATENTRQGIFDAFQRKEVYATTRPRIRLRFFGGFDFKKSEVKARDLAKIGYHKGVAMGGDLSTAPKNKAPTFLIQASKDPNEGNLDRIQIIKGWVDKDGQAEEKIFNVAASDKRKIRDNALEPVGNTVNIKTGAYTNSIGESQLSTLWSDPEFDPDQSAFYYARVLQIPTPRYSLLDAIALGIDPKLTGKDLTIQERAYSSPIWYTP
ncbi:MAG: DUF3604 domain-containing protein [Halioglobus sp.]